MQVADQYSESVRPCRPSVNSCDAPEYCSYGSSANPEDCPPDQPPLVQVSSHMPRAKYILYMLDTQHQTAAAARVAWLQQPRPRLEHNCDVVLRCGSTLSSQAAHGSDCTPCVLPLSAVVKEAAWMHTGGLLAVSGHSTTTVLSAMSHFSCSLLPLRPDKPRISVLNQTIAMVCPHNTGMSPQLNAINTFDWIKVPVSPLVQADGADMQLSQSTNDLKSMCVITPHNHAVDSDMLSVCHDLQIGSGQLPGFGSDTPTFCRPIADDYNAQVPTTTKPVVVSCVESQLQYNYITYQYTPSKGGSTSFVLKPAPIPRWWFSDFLDTYMFIYEGTFNPQAPTTNLIAANDDCTSIVSNKQVPFQLSEALGVPYDPESFEAHVEGSCSTLRVAPNKNYTIVVASFYDNKYEYGPGKSGGFTLLVSSPDGTCPPV